MYMSRIHSLTEYYIAFSFLAIGLSIGWLGPPMYAVSNWFIKKRVKALAFLMAGSSLGGFFVIGIIHHGSIGRRLVEKLNRRQPV